MYMLLKKSFLCYMEVFIYAVCCMKSEYYYGFDLLKLRSTPYIHRVFPHTALLLR